MFHDPAVFGQDIDRPLPLGGGFDWAWLQSHVSVRRNPNDLSGQATKRASKPNQSVFLQLLDFAEYGFQEVEGETRLGIIWASHLQGFPPMGVRYAQYGSVIRQGR